jgi:hypothetical protein
MTSQEERREDAKAANRRSLDFAALGMTVNKVKRQAKGETRERKSEGRIANSEQRASSERDTGRLVLAYS